MSLHKIQFITRFTVTFARYSENYIWAATWDFQQCGMCDQRSLRSVCANAQSDKSLCQPLEYYMTVKLLTEHHLEFLSLKWGCTGSSGFTHVKLPHYWKWHVAAHLTTQLCKWIIALSRECSGSVVECLTQDRRAAGSSLTVVTALCPWARHINPSLVLVQLRKTRHYITERLLMGRKESNQTNKHCTFHWYFNV